MHVSAIQPFKGQSGCDHKTQHVFFVASGEARRRFEFFELARSGHRHTEVLLEVLLQAGQPEGIAHAHHSIQFGLAVRRGVKADRALNLADQVREDGPHGLEDLAGVLARRGLLFEVLRLGEGQLEALGQRFGELVSADRYGPGPDANLVGHHEVGVFRADVHQYSRFVAAQSVEQNGIMGRQRRRLHQRRLDAGVAEVGQVLVNEIALHGEDADFDFR